MSTETVLITGATSGIGLALADEYLANNDKVIACGRNKNVLAALEQQGMSTHQFDVNNLDEIKQASNGINDLDILILNAGDCRYIDDVMSFDGQLFSDIISTNLTSMGILLACFLPKVRSGGQVVFVSSSATLLPFPKSQAYGASKAGLDYLAISLRLDLIPHNIGVTLVHPGFVRTPLTDKNTFGMPFLMTPEDAAKRIVSGISKRKKYLVFPKRLAFFLKLFSFLPISIWHHLMLRSKS